MTKANKNIYKFDCFKPYKNISENRWPRDDGLQACDHPVQVVGPAGQGGEFHTFYRKENFHKLS